MKMLVFLMISSYTMEEDAKILLSGPEEVGVWVWGFWGVVF